MDDLTHDEQGRVYDLVMADARYIEARAQMAGRIRAYDRSIIDDPAISDDEYNHLSTEYGVEQIRELFRESWAPIEAEYVVKQRGESGSPASD